jgi:cell division protein FtsW (lipid II flippase)
MAAGPAPATARLRVGELALLLPAVAVALAGASILLIEHGRALTTTALAPALATIALFAGAHVWLTVRRPGVDQTLLPLAAVLTALGLTLVTRIEPSFGPRQLVWLAIALLGWAVVIAFPRPVRWLAGYRYSSALLGILLLASTLLLGVDPNGSGVRIWLGLGGYYFQPSELLKILLIIFLAAYLEETRDLIAAGGAARAVWRGASIAYLLPIAAMCGISVALQLVQRDLGPALLLFAITLAMLYVATGRASYVAVGAVAFVVSAFVGYRLLPVARLRIDIWLDPWSDSANKGYQIVQGLVAFANGGIFGVGLGYGHPEILPAAHTDFPFAVIGEEMGMVGAAAVLAVFIVLALRGFAIAARAPDVFSSLLATGLSTVLSFQSLIILAGNLKLLPLTGITLPFVSYGGSSLVTNFLILALLQRISAEAAERG